MHDFKNLAMAIVAAIIILVGWQYFYEMPRLKEHERQAAERRKFEEAAKKNNTADGGAKAVLESSLKFQSLEDALMSSGPRVKIESNKVKGSISLTGARIDDIILPEYLESVDPNSAPVRLFSPSKTEKAYFAEFGWTSTSDQSIHWPDAKTVWQANKGTLVAKDSVKLNWQNDQNITFEIEISLDENYLFTIKRSMRNGSGKAILFQEYGLINRIYDQKDKMFISHEGPIGVFNKILKEVSYGDLESDGNMSFNNNQAGSWFGISDKYWLATIIPDQSSGAFDAKLQYARHLGKNKYQADYLSAKQSLAPGGQHMTTSHLFVGAKVISNLEFYERYLNLDLFDRAIDFGWFYFITKPMFGALKYFYDLVGNFGISILIVTILVKIILFPLANKSFHSMNRMKELQPEMNRIRELHADDKMKQNQAVIELYRKEKVSPLSGCLPLIVQIPIFFSLYKVLFITIEMRHAPFFGWIRDLSAPDPTSIFNLFGLIPWNPPAFLMIGVWPIIMALTMFLQQKMSPEPADKMQAQVMKFLPLIFVFMFASFPAGLVIYWAWSNVLSIIQQYFIKSDKFKFKKSMKA